MRSPAVTEASRAQGTFAPGRPIVRRPDVHLLSAYLARRFGCTHVVDLGCPQPRELAKVYPQANIIGLGVDVDLRPARSEYRFGRWLDRRSASDVLALVAPDTAVDALIVATIDPERPSAHRIADDLKRLMDYASAAVVSGSGPGWSTARFRAFLESAGLRVDHVGWTATDDVDRRTDTPLAIVGNTHQPHVEAAPPGYRVIAMMAAYNEEDIIVPSIAGLIEQGAEVYLLDNWSTDRTVERARPFLDRGLIGIEQIPSDGPADTFPYVSILGRKAELSTKLEAEWFIHMDVDEVRKSPWPGVSLKDALYLVDRQGFNAVDHTVLKFVPVDDGYADGSDLEGHFRHFRFVFQQDFQVKMWKNDGRPVALGDGHRAAFAGRRVYPYNFLHKHYPIRSQRHGERKIFTERQTRMDPEELAAGWHGHYGRFGRDQSFLGDPAELLSVDEHDLYESFLMERLSAIGPDERDAWAKVRPELPRWRKLAGRVRRGARARVRRIIASA